MSSIHAILQLKWVNSPRKNGVKKVLTSYIVDTVIGRKQNYKEIEIHSLKKTGGKYNIIYNEYGSTVKKTMNKYPEFVKNSVIDKWKKRNNNWS